MNLVGLFFAFFLPLISLAAPGDQEISNAINSVVLLYNGQDAGSGVIVGTNSYGESIMLTANHNFLERSKTDRAHLPIYSYKGQAQIHLQDMHFVTWAKGEKFFMGLPFFRAKEEFLGDPQVLNNIVPRSDFAAVYVSNKTPSEIGDKSFLLKGSYDGFKPNIEFGSAVPGEEGIMIGFFDEKKEVIGGTILSDAEAEAFARRYFDSTPAFDPSAEILLSEAARPGMSGGGVFDKNGRLIGITVRRGIIATPEKKVAYARAIRVSYILSELSKKSFQRKSALLAGFLTEIQIHESCRDLLLSP
jgi:hypothetical protein